MQNNRSRLRPADDLLQEVVPADESDKALVASYGTYEEAQRAVDLLSDRNFPVEGLSIVAHGIQLVERVTGRFRYPQALIQGVIGGALLGAVFGFIFGLFSWIEPLVSGLALATYGLLFGGILGGVLGLLVHLTRPGRRDFASVTAFEADRYDLMADAAVVDEARLALSEADRPQQAAS